MISGLMIGYVRGYKGLSKPFTSIASKLFIRSLVLYAWMALGSLFYVWLTWALSGQRDMPWYNAPIGDWGTVFNQVLTMQLPHVWVHFLYLYAIFLLFSIPAVWLLRKDQPWIIACLSLIGYIYGSIANIEWLRYQLIFFIPVIVGFYLPAIQAWWSKTHHKKTITTLTYMCALTSVAISAIYVTFEQNIAGSAAVNAIFNISAFSIARVLIATLWFSALVLLFNAITPWLRQYTYGVVHYLGTHSLTAYIAHGLILCGVAILIPVKDSFTVNTLAGLVAVIGVYAFIRLPIIRHLLPR